MSKMKCVRDPVHNLIQLEDLAIRLINTEAFQRLRRIRQLGVVNFVYPSAEHSRFVHSLGVYHLASRILESLKKNSPNFFPTQEEEELVRISALLHDIGHGPYSHMIEATISQLGGSFHHENMGCFILRKDKTIRSILENHRTGFCEEIVNLLSGENHSSQNHLVLHGIVSGQLDADRMDFLLRDSLMSGTRYGWFDCEWLISNLSVEKITDPASRKGENIITVQASKGLNVLEQYLLGRFYMYKHIYYHKAVRAFEAITRNILSCALKTHRPEELEGLCILNRLRNGDLTLNDFYELDDHTLNCWFLSWRKSTKHHDLKALLERFFQRQPFKRILPDGKSMKFQKQYEKILSIYEKLKIDPQWLFVVDSFNHLAYKDPSRLDEITEDIFILDEDKRVRPLGHIRERSIVVNSAEILQNNSDTFLVVNEVFDRYTKG